MTMADQYVQAATGILEELARTKGKPIFYSDLALRLGIAAQSTGGVLRPISTKSRDERKVLLSVLVVSKENGLPSEEFFEQAKALGIMREGELPQQFFRDELNRVYAAYASHDPARSVHA